MSIKSKQSRNLKMLFTRIITFILALTMTLTPLSTMTQYTEHVHAVEEYENGGDGGPITGDGEAIIP